MSNDELEDPDMNVSQARGWLEGWIGKVLVSVLTTVVSFAFLFGQTKERLETNMSRVELQNSKIGEVAALSKFALAQTYESDGKFDDAARLYSDLAKLNSPTITAESANLRLAKVYEKQGKNKEAADLLFNIVDASRKARGSDNQPLPQSSAAREAGEELQKLDPARYAQLPPETPLLAG